MSDIIMLDGEDLDERVLFEPIYMAIDGHRELDLVTRSSLKEDVHAIEGAVAKERYEHTDYLPERLHNLGLAAPDILDIIMLIVATRLEV